MKVVNVRLFELSRLISQVYKVPLAGQPDKLPYDRARIDVRVVPINEIRVAQRYLMRPNLDAIADIAKQLRARDIDIFGLNGYVSVETDAEPGVWRDILPPIVEESPKDNVVYLLCDGAHRLRAAHDAGRKSISVVYVHTIPGEFPYYAFPEDVGISKIPVVDAKPEGDGKKKYRIPNYKTLFRDFNAVFNDVTRAR